MPDMLTMYELPHIIIPRNWACPDNAGFFEASSMRKINGIYYFIYSARINGLHYATSRYPDRDFVYGGRIHSSSDIGLRGYTIDNAAYPNGNTHGSIIAVNNHYYIFDHRFSYNTSFCRQGVAERINIEKNGHISQVEATSCGLNNGPLSAKGTYPSYIACHIRNLTITSDMPKEDRLKLMPYITQDGEDRDYGDDQYIKNMQNGCMVGYKYFNFNNNIDINNNANILTTDYVNNSINSNNSNNNNDNNNNNNDSNNNNDNKNKSFNKINNSGSAVITMAVKGCAAGTISITTDTDYADKKLSDYSICGKKKINISDDDKWTTVDITYNRQEGIKPLYFIFEGEGSFCIKEFSFK